MSKRQTYTQYRTGINANGNEWHEWACVAVDRSCAVHVWMREGPSGWYGGVEQHERPQDGEKVDYEICHLLLGPCRHDGSSLYFDECWKRRCINATEDGNPTSLLRAVECEFDRRFPVEVGE